MPKEPRIELAALLRKLREELTLALAEGEGEKVRFQLESVELELQVTVGVTGKGEGGIKLWLVEAGGGVEAQREGVQKVKLTLKPATDGAWDGRLAAPRPQRPR